MTRQSGHEPSFVHEAFLYDDDHEFFDRMVPFIDDGVESGDAVLVVLDRARIDTLRSVFSTANGSVQYQDMAEVGRNPGRIISAWTRFVADNRSAGRRMRGIGEPIWHGRTDAEIQECQRHEALLNVAFDGTPGFSLMCPYDRSALGEQVLADAGRTHPALIEEGQTRVSPDYEGEEVDPFAGSLPEPSGAVEEFDLAGLTLDRVRTLVADLAAGASLDEQRSGEFVVAVNEAVTNTIRHADGVGVLRLWREDASVICDVVDHGSIRDPLAGRLPADVTDTEGRGLWLINQLCDLVQIRSSETSNVVRMHMHMHL
ncbi:anti-sigma factor RsbA family regulatory protein [Aeromicrobium sp.]|uniref:anti-sigma factor RsbA family regulatory protein n=1 Tax=Aeromicrobium sp. TaxID=1871063 RepID=UPI003D6A82F7